MWSMSSSRRYPFRRANRGSRSRRSTPHTFHVTQALRMTANRQRPLVAVVPAAPKTTAHADTDVAERLTRIRRGRPRTQPGLS